MQQDRAGAELLAHLVRDGGADERHLDDVLLRVLDALPDGLGHLAGLAQASADMPVTVADHDHRAEAEAPAALDDLRDAVDLDDALFERQLGGIDSCHRGPFRGSERCELEVESGFARALGEGTDAAVIAEAGAVEDDLADAGLLGAAGDERADLLGLVALGALALAQLLLERRGGGQRPARRVVDDLGVDLVEAAEDRQPRPLGACPPVSGGCERGASGGRDGGLMVLALLEPPGRGPIPGETVGWVGRGRLEVSLLAADLAGLAGLAADDLAGVADALALVGLRLALCADAGGHVADQLLVDAGDGQAGGVLHLEGDAGRRVDLDRVAVAQVELELAADQLGAVADAGDLEALAVAGGHAGDHVGDQGAGQAVELARALVVAGPLDDERLAVADQPQLRRHVTRQLAARALDGHVGAVDGDLDARRAREWEACRFGTWRSTRRTPGSRRRAGPCGPPRRS